jgi:hypothetical protein
MGGGGGDTPEAEAGDGKSAGGGGCIGPPAERDGDGIGPGGSGGEVADDEGVDVDAAYLGVICSGGGDEVAELSFLRRLR